MLLERGVGVGKRVRLPRPCSRTCPDASAGAVVTLALADAEAEAIAFLAEAEAIAVTAGAATGLFVTSFGLAGASRGLDRVTGPATSRCCDSAVALVVDEVVAEADTGADVVVVRGWLSS